MRLAFCQRDVAAARRDLVRICSEIREELAEAATQAATTAAVGAEPATAARRIDGAIYVSCSGRGGPHFGGAVGRARRSCATRSATCRWSASSPPARSRATTSTATPAC